jgi:hypothetical protein
MQYPWSYWDNTFGVTGECSTGLRSFSASAPVPLRLIFVQYRPCCGRFISTQKFIHNVMKWIVSSSPSKNGGSVTAPTVEVTLGSCTKSDSQATHPDIFIRIAQNCPNQVWNSLLACHSSVSKVQFRTAELCSVQVRQHPLYFWTWTWTCVTRTWTCLFRLPCVHSGARIRFVRLGAGLRQY